MSDQYPYKFGKYRVEAEIGRGGFGAVYRSLDLDLERSVAIKIMDPIYLRDRRWVARFRREAKVMAKLDHPHIVPIYDTGEEDGRLYLAMKLIDGPDLTRLIAEEGALPWDNVVKIAGQVASALDYAHERGIIHRDLKPGNILINDGDAVLTDFGLAKMLDDNSMSLSVSGGVTGTYNYMPPEVFNDEDATPASDVYALGCVLYEMLVGKMLFDGKTTAAIVGAHLKGISLDEPLPDGIPAGTLHVLQTSLAREPEDRYASAGEMAEELARLSSDRLAVPYASLQQAMADSQWQEALEIAATISAQDPNYRDLVALEEEALAENEADQRRQWAAQWQASAEEALAADNFDEVHGAINQWHRVAPNDPQLPVVEKELLLAEQYIILQRLIAARNWEDAQPAAATIYDQDDSFREIAALQAEIDAHMEPPQDAATVIDTPQDEQDLRTAGAAVVGTAAVSRQESVRTQAPDSTVESKPQDPTFSPPAADATPPKKKATGVPVWAWGIGAIAIVLLLVFGIVSLSGGPDEEPREEPAPAEEAAAPEEEAAAPEEEAAAAEEEAEEEPVVTGEYLNRALAGEFNGTAVTILGSFVDSQETLFIESIAGFEAKTGIDIQYSGSNEFETNLSVRVDAGDTPDIVNFPWPLPMANYASQGSVVDVSNYMPQEMLLERYNPSWLEMATVAGAEDDIMGGVWHWFNPRGIVFYPLPEFDEAGYEVPQTWHALLALTQTIADDGDTAWCIGIESGAATGWPATFWTAEMMMRTTSLENYDAWTKGELAFSSPEVGNAIETWSEIWFNPKYVFGGTDSIVTTNFGNSPQGMFESPPQCWLHLQGDFITGFFPEGAVYGRDYGFFYLPPVDEAYGRPMVVAGDIMTQFNDRDEVRAVMEYFTTPDSTAGWRMQAISGFSPQLQATADMYGSELSRDIATLVETATSFRYNASDIMPGEVGFGTFWSSMTDYVSGAVDLDTALQEIDASWPD